ncbi:hypothetical protein [Pseudoalteromonas aliena]|uniref:hypothetical protein n=1 Tax=Pseudoalteromonas aliena TaxID=247523 RepID=UPI0024943267|nr:hypothetical protein [Pseudoalteromonas aliena]
MALARLFIENDRASSELVTNKPKARAKDLLEELKGKLTIQASIDEMDEIISQISKK